MFYCTFVRIMQFFKLNMKESWETSVGEVKLWEYRYVFVLCPFTLVIRLINCWDFIQIWYDNKMLSSQWDNNTGIQHFVYTVVSWYLLGIISRQGFLFLCSCMNKCTCSFFAFVFVFIICRADLRFPPSQWETSLQSNAVSHWLGANLGSALVWYQGGVSITHMSS